MKKWYEEQYFPVLRSSACHITILTYYNNVDIRKINLGKICLSFFSSKGMIQIELIHFWSLRILSCQFADSNRHFVIGLGHQPHHSQTQWTRFKFGAFLSEKFKQSHSVPNWYRNGGGVSDKSMVQLMKRPDVGETIEIVRHSQRRKKILNCQSVIL